MSLPNRYIAPVLNFDLDLGESLSIKGLQPFVFEAHSNIYSFAFSFLDRLRTLIVSNYSSYSTLCVAQHLQFIMSMRTCCKLYFPSGIKTPFVSQWILTLAVTRPLLRLI